MSHMITILEMNRSKKRIAVGKKENMVQVLQEKTILTILTFPILCMAVWRTKTLIPLLKNLQKNPEQMSAPVVQPIDCRYTVVSKPSCEILLPKLFQDLQANGYTKDISDVATVHEPGPFTAVRAGLAFARGLACGTPGWSFFSTSLFELLPLENRDITMLDTGSHHWVNAQGQMFPEPTHPEYALSFSTCSPQQALSWSQQLALCTIQNTLTHAINPPAINTETP